MIAAIRRIGLTVLTAVRGMNFGTACALAFAGDIALSSVNLWLWSRSHEPISLFGAGALFGLAVNIVITWGSYARR